jgi:hypothetical protein
MTKENTDTNQNKSFPFSQQQNREVFWMLNNARIYFSTCVLHTLNDKEEAFVSAIKYSKLKKTHLLYLSAMHAM